MAMDGYRGFLGLLVSALLVGFLSVLFTLIWVLHYREGLGWNGGALEFNWHPVLAVTGFVFIQGIASPRVFHLSASLGTAVSPSTRHARACLLWTSPLRNSDCHGPHGSDGEAIFCPEKSFIPFIPPRRCFHKYPGPSDSGVRGSGFLDCHQTTVETSQGTRVYASSVRSDGRGHRHKLWQQRGQIRFRVKQ
ncbi:plasma membrane ascorbate-dependent reductase CYBRD1 isoform X2 [Castor canadensis]|uniref:Plasma membrane ascorbate-dependent reductase CYBRD1 isoform X2 n=1 Tax=Castor canadensis TaxID=51338 RepID=A0AC58MCS2_CASCN